ncbi:hypothetical protein BOSEA31B_14573 [Hyphomicrobiales bacterium]|nr:hypothetical protein BOSEA31B_14573 [Hyphomicrobiales bacterium]CAI0344128.1 hypothetical protein BO1005MUT1_310157 [Hyphomicrobiales bacterium]
MAAPWQKRPQLTRERRYPHS